MKSLNKILVPIDFSEQSLIALDQSYNLAREYKAEITLLYVLEQHEGLVALFGPSEKEEAEKKRKIEAELEKLADKVYKKEKIKVNYLVAKGRPYEKIVEVSEMIGAMLIMMGTNGTVGIRKKFIGSNALRVVRETTCPVITIKGKYHRNGCKNIVLPLDLSKETKEKVGKAIEIARMSNSVIHVVSALFTKDEFIVNHLTRQLDQVEAFIKKAGIECTAEIIKGIKGEESFADVIIDYAKKKDADLLMIMTQKEEDVVERFVSSTAQEIINKSDIPVLSVVPMLKRDTMVFNPY